MQAQRIVSVKSIGIQRSVDIEIDSEDHIFFANGIATSNSHAISYSFPSYWSAYIKRHKTLDFYKTWLTYSSNKLDPHAEVKALVMSARMDDVEILPPSIKYMTKDFFISKDSVVFGLSHIKGVGDKELDKLFNLIKIHGINCSLVTYLTEILPNINKRTTEALVRCGCFSYLGISRNLLLHLYDCFSSLSDKELAFFTDKVFDTPMSALKAAAAIKKDGGACSTKSRVAKILEIIERISNPGRSMYDTPAWISENEEALMGISLSANEIINLMKSGIGDTTCKEFKRGKGGKVTIVGKVKEIKEHKTKDDNLMAFITIEDDSAELDNVVCFSEQYELYKDSLYNGALVSIFGESGKKKSLVVNRVVEL